MSKFKDTLSELEQIDNKGLLKEYKKERKVKLCPICEGRGILGKGFGHADMTCSVCDGTGLVNKEDY